MNNPKTILLIDDEVDLRQLVKIALKSKGYTIETACDGIEGLAKLETLKPDLIILDMNMPKMGGIEFYERICNQINQPKYPVLVLTARANMEQLFKGFNIDGFMTKPFEIDDLLRTVDTIIKRRSGVAIKFEKYQPPRICFTEDDEEAFNKISSAFLNAGYIVNPSRSGTDAIERISATVPEIAVIKLGLKDIPGDTVIGKLKRMAMTRDVKFILYTECSVEKAEKAVIAKEIGKKEGVDLFVEYSDPQDLVQAVKELLKT